MKYLYPPKFWPSVLFYVTLTIKVLLHIQETIFGNLGFMLFYRTRFISKILANIRYIFGFFSKSQRFTLQNGRKWKDFENF